MCCPAANKNQAVGESSAEGPCGNPIPSHAAPFGWKILCPPRGIDHRPREKCADSPGGLRRRTWLEPIDLFLYNFTKFCMKKFDIYHSSGESWWYKNCCAKCWGMSNIGHVLSGFTACHCQPQPGSSMNWSPKKKHGITNPDVGMVLEKKTFSHVYPPNPLFVLGTNMVTVEKVYFLWFILFLFWVLYLGCTCEQC